MASAQLTDDILAFINRFLDIELESQTARYARADNFREVRRPGAKMWFKPSISMNSVVYYSELSEREKEQQAALMRRRLFKATAHDHPKRGAVYTFQVSSDSKIRGADRYVARFDAADTEKGFRFISRHVTCPDCHASGRDGSCSGCGGTGWKFESGDDLGPLPPAVDVRRFDAPEDDRYRVAHERDS